MRPGFAPLLGIWLGILGLGVASATAEIYRWTDADGRVHFTQDLNQVPPDQRASAKEKADAPKGLDPIQTFTATSPSRTPGSKRMKKESEAKKVYRIPVQRAGTNMMVNVRLNNTVSALFVVDTGASDVLLPQSVADALGFEAGPNTRTKRYLTANGVVEHPVVMLRSVNLGGAEVQNVPASISPSLHVGLLGLSFFNHFNYNIDAERGIVTLRPNRLAESGQIVGGRSQAQWQAEYDNLHKRREFIETERGRTHPSHSREHRRLAGLLLELERQGELLDAEADQARVPMNWRY